MIERIFLGENLRRLIVNKRAAICDAILAEEQRMSVEICEEFARQGSVIPGFVDRTGRKMQDFESQEERSRILYQIFGDMDEAGDYYISPQDFALSSDDLPISIELDILDQGKKLKMIFCRANGEVLSESDFDLGRKVAFIEYWRSFAQQRRLDPSITLALVEEFDRNREGAQLVGQKILDSMADKAGFMISVKLSIRLFEFIATLWPSPLNPMPGYLANPDSVRRNSL